ncbi:hypothetical protein MMC26_000543 [Xylographa opegraphella]|nr:hypothetical protein [Xylographa opegraphella]
MAAASSIAPVQRQHHSSRRTRASKHKPHGSTSSTSSSEDYADVPEVEKLREARIDYYGTPTKDRCSAFGRPMAQDREQRHRTSVRGDSRLDVTASSGYLDRSGSHAGHRHRRRKQKEEQTADDGVYVYKSMDERRVRRSRTSPRTPGSEDRDRSTSLLPDRRRVLRTLGLDGQSRTTEHKEIRRSARPMGIRRTSSDAGDTRVHSKEPRRLGTNIETITSKHEPRVARSASMRETSRSVSRPTLVRSQTSVRRVRRVAAGQPSLPPVREDVETVVTSSRKIERPSNILGSIFGGQKVASPEAQIECLTCMSDDIPVSKSAKLACGHRMCHACLRRIFTMSVTDPAHMPPTCCTSEHIPLKHVDKLFDLKFKMKWNKKYQEYTTANRLYCPAKGCGEWIKPAHIHPDPSGGPDNGGRSYGKCSRCKTKVCATCNGRWHSSRECPADDATAQFAAIAQAQGWQRCFNCSATVELKEGCNHMTCRCRAEFCMICGAKWKSCDCPWFNYAAVEHDRLLHLNVAQARGFDGLRPADRVLPRAYHEELDRRRVQERDDEAFARRVQGLHLGEQGNHQYPAGVLAVGNAAGHFLNEHFVNRATGVLAANYVPAQVTNPPPPPPPPPPPVLLRQCSAASRRYDGLVAHGPRRGAADYIAPGRVTPLAAAACEPVTRHSAMAGLTRNTPGERVDEWRRHVEDGGSVAIV